MPKIPNIKQPKNSTIPWWARSMTHNLIIVILSIVLYANTLGHDYTLDDAIVIYNNEFTQQGFQGLPDLVKYDSFRGFFKKSGKDKLVSGGRYRPLTPISFALENQFFGENPTISHLVNILSYVLLILLIYSLLARLLSMVDVSEPRIMAWIVSILFAVHPVHTEVIANIKGRDEIWALGFGLLAFYILVKFMPKGNNLKTQLLVGISIFLAMMSKENAIIFGAIIPLGLFIFYKKKLWEIIQLSSGLGIGIILYLILRFSILGLDTSSTTPMELMNNPFLKQIGDDYVSMNWNEKMGTIFVSLGHYVKLLFWPYPLTHDYYPRYIEMTTLMSPKALMSLLVYGALIIWGIKSFFRRSIHAFSIALIILPLLLVSNLIFPIGTNMGERFIFFSSLGWAMIIGGLFYHFIQNKQNLTLGILALVIVGFSFTTIKRNRVWKDDYTLFTTDVKTSVNSAKVQNAAAGAKATKAGKMKDVKARNVLYKEALDHANKAIKIHPKYANAVLIKGICHFGLESYEKAIASFEKVLQMSPNSEDAKQNLFLSYREAGKYYGEQKGDAKKALSFLTMAEQLNPSDEELWRLMGIANGMSGNPQKAIEWFEKMLTKKPKDARVHLNLSISYRLINDMIKANFHQSEAIKIDPGIINKNN